jgi:hypothetical protein
MEDRVFISVDVHDWRLVFASLLWEIADQGFSRQVNVWCTVESGYSQLRCDIAWSRQCFRLFEVPSTTLALPPSR